MGCTRSVIPQTSSQEIIKVNISNNYFNDTQSTFQTPDIGSTKTKEIQLKEAESGEQILKKYVALMKKQENQKILLSNQEKLHKRIRLAPLKIPPVEEKNESIQQETTSEVTKKSPKKKNSNNLQQKVQRLNSFQLESNVQIKLKKVGNIKEFYQISSVQIGKGHYSVVYQALQILTQRVVALKVISKSKISDSNSKYSIFQEIKLISKLNHCNIIKILDFLHDDSNYYIVQELCEGGSLKQWFYEKNISEKKISQIMAQVFSALNYMHSKNIMHRDLKLENICFTNIKQNQIKIIDFGFATVIQPGVSLNEFYGTPNYISPEILKERYDQRSDNWSAGVMLYALLLKRFPYQAENSKKLLDLIDTEEPFLNNKNWSVYSKESQQLVQQLLIKDPDNRISAQEVLSSPWIQKFKSYTSCRIFLLERLQQYYIQSSNSIDATLKRFIIRNVFTIQDQQKYYKDFRALDIHQTGYIEFDCLFDAYMQMTKNKDLAYNIVNQIFLKHKQNQFQLSYEDFLIGIIKNETVFTFENLEKMLAILKYSNTSNNTFCSFQQLTDKKITLNEFILYFGFSFRDEQILYLNYQDVFIKNVLNEQQFFNKFLLA